MLELTRRRCRPVCTLIRGYRAHRQHHVRRREKEFAPLTHGKTAFSAARMRLKTLGTPAALQGPGHDPDEPARARHRLARGAGDESLGSLAADEQGVADRRLARRLRPVRPLSGEPPWCRSAVLDAPRPGPEGPDSDREALRARQAALPAGLDAGPAGEADAPDEPGSARCGARSPSTKPRSRARRSPPRNGRFSRSASTMHAARSRICGTRAPARSLPGRPPASRSCSRRGTARSS